jgi:hypothetical protein
MYSYLAREPGKLTPARWRIPSVQDFEELDSYVSENGLVCEEVETLK